MEGRWAIHVDDEGTGWCIEARDATPFDEHYVPVVPCDDAAIGRAAYALCCDPVVDLFDGLSNGDTDRDYPRLIAEAVLRAAGATP